MVMAGMVYDSVHGSAPWTGMAYGYVTLTPWNGSATRAHIMNCTCG